MQSADQPPCAQPGCPNKAYFRKALCHAHEERVRLGRPLDAPLKGNAQATLRPTVEGADLFAAQVVTQHRAVIWSYIRSKVEDLQTAEDITQEVMLRCWQNADHLMAKPAEAIRPWLFVVAKRRVINDWRGGRLDARNDSVDEIMSDLVLGLHPESLTSDPIAEWVATEPILAALRRLTVAERLAITATALLGMTGEEAGEALGVGAGTIRRNAFNGRKHLYELLRDVPEVHLKENKCA